MLVIAFSMTVVGCTERPTDNDPSDDYTPPSTTELTGTVTITSEITVSGTIETKKSTANVSGLNGTVNMYYSYQWISDDANISGATSTTYNVTTADYDKTLKVKVTYADYTGEKFGEIAVGKPTILNLTLKRHNTNWGKDTGITIEKTDGSYWGSVTDSTSSYGTLTTTGSTITLTSWTETQFKMRTTYTFIENKFYFKVSGSELFNLTNGTKTYILENTADSFGSLTGLIATEN